ncbi:MAG: MFS transporter [Caldilineaceae bacterium]|nr:MFS transporter [Caldilineaceae bacterium]HRJ43047.1 MFS transporter [Caldilineaceae bacterium]
MHQTVEPRTSRVINATPFFYGWVVLAAGTLGLLLMGPSQGFTVSLFLDLWVADLNLSRSTVSLLYGGASLGAALLLPIAGRLVDRFGPRRLVVVISLGLGLGCLWLVNVQGPIALFIGLLIVRFFGFGSLQIASNNVIAQWFIRRRGFAMGIAGQSLSMGLLVYPWLGESMISQWGWRGAWVGFAALTVGVMIPVGWLFFRDAPERYGLTPDGDSPAERERQRAGAREENWTLEEARQTSAFWIFFVAISVITMTTAGVVFHQVSLFAQRGFERASVIHVFQMVALFTVGGNLLFGKLLDWYTPRRLMTVALGALVLALLVVQWMFVPWHTVLFSGLMGFAGGAFRVLDASLWPHYYGRQHLGAIRGLTMMGTMGGTALGPYPLGLSYDFLGSYVPALWSFIGLLGAMALILVFLHPPRKGKST